MTKPKFTPDPPPYLQGIPVEKAFPLFVDWVIRQEYRKEDWWPKDFEDRVQTLERLSPYCIGEWTIADAAYMNFGYEVAQIVDPAFALFTLSAVSISTTDYDGFGAFGSSIGSSIGVITSDPDGTIAAIDNDDLLISTDAVSWSTITAATLGHASGSPIKRAVYSDGKWVIICVPTSGTGFRVLHTNDFVSFDVVYETTDRVTEGIHTADTDGSGNFVLAGYDISTQITTAWYSSDNGETWGESSGLPNATLLSRRGTSAFYEGGRWFILGTRESIWVSDNRVDWSLVYTSTDQFQSAACVRYGDGTFICVQSSSTPLLLSSADGSSWTSQGAFASSNRTSLFYHPTQKWVFASGNNLRKSPDGINWSVVSGSWSSLTGVTEIFRQA